MEPEGNTLRNAQLDVLTLELPVLRGKFHSLYLYEVAEAIRLDALRPMLKSGGAESPAGVSRQIPQYLKFERPPVVEPIEPVVLETGERLDGSAKF